MRAMKADVSLSKTEVLEALSGYINTKLGTSLSPVAWGAAPTEADSRGRHSAPEPGPIVVTFALEATTSPGGAESPKS